MKLKYFLLQTALVPFGYGTKKPLDGPLGLVIPD
jgi:hypothetical protein